MKIDTWKLKKYILREMECHTRARAEAVEHNNFTAALEADIELNVWEYLLSMYEEPEEFDFIEVEDDSMV